MAELLLVVVVGSAVWVYADAAQLAKQRGFPPAGTSPGRWALGTLLLWIAVFPIYLVRRRETGEPHLAEGRPLTIAQAEAEGRVVKIPWGRVLIYTVLIVGGLAAILYAVLRVAG